MGARAAAQVVVFFLHLYLLLYPAKYHVQFWRGSIQTGRQEDSHGIAEMLPQEGLRLLRRPLDHRGEDGTVLQNARIEVGVIEIETA